MGYYIRVPYSRKPSFWFWFWFWTLNPKPRTLNPESSFCVVQASSRQAFGPLAAQALEKESLHFNGSGLWDFRPFLQVSCKSPLAILRGSFKGSFKGFYKGSFKGFCKGSTGFRVYKGECTQIVYTLAPKYLYREYSKARVYAIWVRGPLRKQH